MAVAFLPLIVTTGTLFPYIFGKMTFFQLITVALLSIYVILFILWPEKYKISLKHPLLIAVFLLLIANIFSAIFGVDPIRSFWSTQERMTGVLAQIHLFIFMILASTLIRGWGEWRKVLYANIIGALLVSFYGFGKEWSLPGFLARDMPGRITSTIGNPTFVAAYVLFPILWSLFLFVKEKTRGLKIFNGGVFVYLSIFLWITAVRGGTIAWTVGVLFLFGGLLLISQNKKLKIAVGTVGAGVILLWVAILINHKSAWVQNTVAFSRIATLATFKQTVFDSPRFYTWRLATRAFLERPLLGYGPENFNVAYNTHFDPILLKHGLGETWFDRAHSVIFETLSTLGIIGFIAFIGVVATIFFSIYRLRRRKIITNYEALIFSAMFITYFAQNIVVFDMPAVLFTYYIALAWLLSSTQQLFDDTESIAVENAPKDVRQYVSSSHIFAIVGVGIILIYGAWYFSLQPFIASLESIRALQNSFRSLPQGIAEFQKAFGRGTFVNSEIRLQLLNPYGNLLNIAPQEHLRAYAQFMWNEMEKNVNEHPHDVRLKIVLAETAKLVVPFIPDALQKADALLDSSRELNGTRQQLLWTIGEIKLQRGNYSEALNAYVQAAQLAPEVGMSRWYLAIMLFSGGSIDDAIEQLKAAEKYDYPYAVTEDENMLSFMLKILKKEKKYEYAAHIADEMFNKRGMNTNAALAKDLAFFYKNSDNNKKGRYYFEIVKQLDPSMATSSYEKL